MKPLACCIEQTARDRAVQATWPNLAATFIALQVPSNLKLLAVPLYECFEGIAKFGAVIAALPHILSRFRLTVVGPERLLAIEGSSNEHSR